MTAPGIQNHEGRGIYESGALPLSYLGCQDLTLVQRESAGTKLIFAMGKMEQGRFQMMHWKENVGDEEEDVLGTVQLKNGREFLITTVTDPAG